eukprot:6333416-Amphidinium_carterae.1
MQTHTVRPLSDKACRGEHRELCGIKWNSNHGNSYNSELKRLLYVARDAKAIECVFQAALRALCTTLRCKRHIESLWLLYLDSCRPLESVPMSRCVPHEAHLFVTPEASAPFANILLW